MLRILQQYPVSDNPPFTQHHQLLTPTPRVALSRACKCSVANTSGRVCMVFPLPASQPEDGEGGGM